VASSVYSRTLQKAAELVGSRKNLARHLAVPLAELEKWLAGHAVPPTGTFLRAVDLVVEQTPAPSGGESSGTAASDPGEPPPPRESSSFRRSC